jgi:anaerobic magnesium-protoporphyrin IX monomethyl ester cyclase
MSRGKVLIVDLNNYARYPTLAIGYLVAPLRSAGFEVELLSPLAHGVTGVMREHREGWVDHLKRSFYMVPPVPFIRRQDRLHDAYAAWQNRLTASMRTLLEGWIAGSRADVILLSAYLTHQPRVAHIAQVAARLDIPVLLGGPAFNMPGVAVEWRRIPGVTAVFAGEAEHTIVAMVDALVRRASVEHLPAVFTESPGTRSSIAKQPLDPIPSLDDLVIPDFSDFPWDRYPHRIVPLMASRGCGWGRCTFCSDVRTANGRGFRSRSAERVLDEVATQAARYNARDFIFLDIKLNSDLALWRGIIDGIPRRVSDARWIGTVHVHANSDNGLERDTLEQAHAAGMRRISFGLESGSQRILRRMAKNCTVERNESFARDATAAGLSVRATMILGYPGETAADVDLSTRFLERNHDHLDRINLCRFKPVPGTRFERMYRNHPERYPDVHVIEWDHRTARASYVSAMSEDPHYRAAARRLLRAVHTINRKTLGDHAAQFDGLM